jgi:2-desacetyl-2-hydroxyethyl bacteriochlorophyllide A dehydrogenase
MRCARFTGEREVRIEDVPRPQLGEGEALIEVRAAGICGSDLHRYRGHDPWSGSVTYPWRGGHELAGVVVEVAAGVKALRVGQRVAVEPMQLAGCGTCSECLQGESNLCQNRGASPLRRTTTGFAEFDVAAATHLYEFPDQIPFQAAALADVYACAVHALHRIPLSVNETATIIGCGPIGIALGQVARMSGARTIMVGKRQEALASAQALGAADDVVVVSESNAEGMAKLGSETHVVFEAVGGASNESLMLALQAVSPGGTIGILGAFSGDVAVPYRMANRKEITLRWCNGYSTWRGEREFAMALRWIVEGKVNAAGLVTHCFSLDRIAEAFQTADNKRVSRAIKVMIVR